MDTCHRSLDETQSPPRQCPRTLGKGQFKSYLRGRMNRNWEPNGCVYKAKVNDIRQIMVLALKLGMYTPLPRTLKWLSWIMIDNLEPSVFVTLFHTEAHVLCFLPNHSPMNFPLLTLWILLSLLCPLRGDILKNLSMALFIVNLSISQSTRMDPHGQPCALAQNEASKCLQAS